MYPLLYSLTYKALCLLYGPLSALLPCIPFTTLWPLYDPLSPYGPLPPLQYSPLSPLRPSASFTAAHCTALYPSTAFYHFMVIYPFYGHLLPLRSSDSSTALCPLYCTCFFLSFRETIPLFSRKSETRLIKNSLRASIRAMLINMSKTFV
jgi:hypothetical protein